MIFLILSPKKNEDNITIAHNETILIQNIHLC